MKTLILIVMAIGSFAVVGCNDLVTEPPPGFFQDDIRDVVFRCQFENNHSGLQQYAKVYFVGLYVPGDSTRQGYYTDLSNEFMARFQGNLRPMKKASQCSVSAGGMVDIQTGDRGLLFRIESIRDLSNSEVEVEGGYFEAGVSASGNIYTVRRVDKHWVVVEDLLIWIS